MIDYSKVLEESSILESNRLILRPFTYDDVDDIHLYTSDDLVTKYLNWPTCKDKSETLSAFESYYYSRTGIFAIELKSERKCIGCIDLRVIVEHEKASFGFVLNRAYWNNNYMSEALNMILDLSFLRLELNRVEATHYVGNEGSGRVMQKCGLKYEGTGIQEVKIKGHFQDVVHYAILREQWIRSNAYGKID